MPVLLGIGLLEVAITFVLVGLALTTRAWAQPLADALGHVPGIGGTLKGWVESGINAIVHGLESLLHANLGVLRDLFHGTAEALRDFVAAPLEFARDAEAALHYLRHVAVPALIGAAVSPLHHALTQAEARLHALEGASARGASALAHRLDALTTHVARDLERPLDGLLAHTVPELRATDAAILHAITAVLQPGIATAEHEAGAALGGLQNLEHRIDAAQLWKLAATLAALLPFVAALETEAGLGRAECRTKVRGICTTDPAAWADLLAGLTAIGVGFSIAELIQLGIEGVGQARPLVDTLAGQ